MTIDMSPTINPSRTTTSSATTIGSWTTPIAQALLHYHLDPDPIFAAADIDINKVQSPEVRVPVTKMTRLWELAVDATQDECFGITVGEYVNPTTFHFLGFTALASKSFFDIAQTIQSQSELFSEAGSLKVMAKENHFVVEIVNSQEGKSLAPPRLAWEAFDALLAGIVFFCRQFLRVTIPSEAIYLARPEPKNSERFKAFFQCPIQFNAETNKIIISKQAFLNTLTSYNPRLVEINTQLANNYINDRAEPVFIQQTKQLIADLIKHGEISPEAVARKTNMSLRNFQRKLQDNEQSYTRLLEEVREEVAIEMLANKKYTINEIAHMLGFASQSSFSRAFKKWTGLNPSQYHKTDVNG